MTIKKTGGIFGRNPTFNDVTVDGTLTASAVGLDGAVTINESGAAVNFRVEGDNDTHLIFADGTNDRVGIGTDETALFNTAGGNAKLVVTGNSSSTSISGNTNAALVIANGDGTANNTAGLHFAREDGDGAPNYAGASIVAQFPQAQINGQYPQGEMAFFTSTSQNSAPSEKMRIPANGGLLIGTTETDLNDAGDAGVYVEAGGRTKIAATGQEVMQINRSEADTSSRNIILFYRNGANVGKITGDGTSVAYVTSSDYRLKENVTAISGATDRLKQLNPVRFNFIADTTKTVDGFLAHELQAHVPEAVTGIKDGMQDEEYEITPAVFDDDGNEVTPAVMGIRSIPDYQGIDQAKIVPLLVATIKELEARITALEAG